MTVYKYKFIRKVHLVVGYLALLLLGGCDEPAPDQRRVASAAPPASEFSMARRDWLDIKDRISPAVWLASREAERDVTPNDPAASELRGLLDEADRKFTEGTRMIANRAVQVQAMLAERGVTESPREVISGLVSIAAPDERAGFGETCQHYVNARASSPSREAALQALSRQPLPKASEGADEP